MTDTITPELRKTFIQQVLGPRGGLFAFGVMTGATVMFFFMERTVVAEQERHYESQIASLERRVEHLESENRRIEKRLEDIAFKKINE